MMATKIPAGTQFSIETIASTASYVIYSAALGVISEHERPSEAVVAFFQHASRQIKTSRAPLPGIFRRTPEGWTKV
jgi:hypothetical protein